MASGFAELLKEKPKVPKYVNLDFEQEQIDQAKANQAALPYLEPLARDVNRFMREETAKSLRESLPGAYEKIQENINAALQGQLPSDVEGLIRRKSAERGISRGTTGSQFGQFDELRNLGLTSLQRTDFGIDAAERWMQLSRSPVMDVTSGFVPIQQRMNIRLEEQRRQFERSWLRNKIAAIPSGWKAVGISALNYISDAATSVLSAYTGGAMAGGGGGGGAGGGGGGGGWGGTGSPNWAGMGGIGGGGGYGGAGGGGASAPGQAWWEQP